MNKKELLDRINDMQSLACSAQSTAELLSIENEASTEHFLQHIQCAVGLLAKACENLGDQLCELWHDINKPLTAEENI